MKRTLTIHIDANRVTCGECDYTDAYCGRPYCQLFLSEALGYTDRFNESTWQRCAPCLAAEREASDAGV